MSEEIKIGTVESLKQRDTLKFHPGEKCWCDECTKKWVIDWYASQE